MPREVLDDMGRLGFFGLRIPEEHGGIGLGALASVIFAEEFGRSTYGGFTITALVHTDLAMPYLLNFGSDEQKSAWLPKLPPARCSPRSRSPSPTPAPMWRRSAPRPVATVTAGVLNGSKMFITNGGIADLVFVAAKTHPEVERLAGDIDLRRAQGHPGVHGEQGTGEDGLALLRHLRARPSTTVWVPEDQPDR